MGTLSATRKRTGDLYTVSIDERRTLRKRVFSVYLKVSRGMDPLMRPQQFFYMGGALGGDYSSAGRDLSRAFVGLVHTSVWRFGHGKRGGVVSPAGALLSSGSGGFDGEIGPEIHGILGEAGEDIEDV